MLIISIGTVYKIKTKHNTTPQTLFHFSLGHDGWKKIIVDLKKKDISSHFF